MDRQSRTFALPEYAAILSFVDAIFAELNMGLLIYHAEDAEQAHALRLIYANREASNCTGVDLQSAVGKTIVEAFPSLAGTGLPQAYLAVANREQARELGVVAYADAAIEPSEYRVKAFPMPNRCVGVLFERLDRGGDRVSR